VRKRSWFILAFISLLTLIIIPGSAPVLAGPNPQSTIIKSIFIQSPRDGQALQGVEIIDGKIRGEGFLKGTIHFSYADSPEQERTWFFVAEIDGENEDSTQTSFQVEWDTTQITDGEYDLRVVAEYNEAAAIFELVQNIRIRNHSPVETATPGLEQEATNEEIPLPVSDTPLPRMTSTPLPVNPVEVGTGDLQQVVLISGVVVAAFFFIGMIYWYFSSKLR
jgi:hypothetical protein